MESVYYDTTGLLVGCTAGADPPCADGAVVAGEARATRSVESPQTVSLERPTRPRNCHLSAVGVNVNSAGRAKEIKHQAPELSKLGGCPRFCLCLLYTSDAADE